MSTKVVEITRRNFWYRWNRERKKTFVLFNCCYFYHFVCVWMRTAYTIFSNWIKYFVFSLFSDKKPKPENIDIFTLKTTTDGRCKVTKYTLADIWKQGFIIRINNFGDKEKSPHTEKDIKSQVRIQWFVFFSLSLSKHIR